MNPPLPVVSGAEVVKALITAGFFEVSQRGSHVKLRKGDATVIVPMHKELAAGTLRSIIRHATFKARESQFTGRYWRHSPCGRGLLIESIVDRILLGIQESGGGCPHQPVRNKRYVNEH